MRGIVRIKRRVPCGGLLLRRREGAFPQMSPDEGGDSAENQHYPHIFVNFTVNSRSND